MDALALSQIEAQVRAALGGSLPGIQAHTALAPQPRRGWRAGYVPDASRRAAGLLLLYPNVEQTFLVLTVRAGALAQHAGQVSLPGGAIEPTETVEQAALREAGEEIGLDATQVRILGALTPLYIPVSDFVLCPVAGVCDTRPVLRAAAKEVDRILEVPFDELLGGTRLRRGVRWRDGRAYDVPYFELCGERVWGATAMVLSELLWLLGRPQNPWAAETPGRGSRGSAPDA